MAPTEETILKSFLLQKAGLRDVLTLAEFTTYFPSSKRTSPLIRQLYRDLQSQRNAICDSVLKQINLECRLGENLVARKRAARESDRHIGSAETETEYALQVHQHALICGLNLVKLFGQVDPDSTIRLDAMLPHIESAVQKLQEDMDKIQREIDGTLVRLQRYVLAGGV
jgi:centromere-localized protein 2